MEGGAQCLGDRQPPVQPSRWSSLAQPHPRSETGSCIPASEKTLDCKCHRCRRGFPGGSPADPALPVSPSLSARKFPSGPRGLPSPPHCHPQHLEALRRGRCLVPRFPASRSVATGPGEGSLAPSGGRPRGGAWSPAVQPPSGGGGASGVQMRSGWRRARTVVEKRSRSPRVAQGAGPRGYAQPVSSRPPDPRSATHRISVRSVAGVHLAL